ncbi:MAG: hypothetical protein ACRDCN_09620 [Tannerellaceae bacterium]
MEQRSYNTTTQLRRLSSIILLGSIWGMIEATLGWTLHILHFPGSNLILYTIAVTIMMLAILNTKKASSAFMVALVAAIIKLTNLVIGTIPPFWVINPAVSIILEGLSFYLVYVILQKGKLILSSRLYLSSLFILFVSQVVFDVWRIISHELIGFNPAITSTNLFSEFSSCLFQSVCRLVLIIATIFLLRDKSLYLRIVQPVLSCALLIIAVILTNTLI